MFNFTLDMWNTTVVDLELEDDAKPVCSRPYPAPRLHVEMFKKESKQLLSLGVPKNENDPEWGSPYFAQPKEKQIG